jgi:hypothetical protein
MKIIQSFSFLLFLFLLSANCLAQPIPEGFGIVYGQGFGFNLKAPKGWVLDNQSGVSQGMHAVFYPKGGTWDDSPVVAYAQSRPKTDTIKSADDAAQATIKKFHEDGSLKYQGKLAKTFKSNTGQDGVIYYFSGDKWGNNEAVAYYVEPKRINFIVMNAREKAIFDQSLPAFEELAKSYKPMEVTITPPPGAAK